MIKYFPRRSASLRHITARRGGYARRLHDHSFRVFPEYPVLGVEETIGFHLLHGPALRDFLKESFYRFQLTGLTLICLKNETKVDAERDLRDLISTASADVAERRLANGWCVT